MKSAVSFIALSAALALASGSAALARTPPPAPVMQYGPAGDYPVTIGDPFTIDGVTYTPSDTMNYDAVGYAQSGEGAGVSGAHRTLPIPSYVEVTSLDSGKTIVVRLDRRGPMSGDRLVELSPQAWAQLGLTPGAKSPVRVRRVNPPEQERALLRTGQMVPDRMDTPPGLLAALKRKLGIVAPAPVPDDTAKPVPPQVATTRPVVIPAKPMGRSAAKPATAPKPAPLVKAAAKPPIEESRMASAKPEAAPKPQPAKPEPVARSASSTGGSYVQVGAYSSRDRAEKVAQSVGGSVSAAGKVWRVRIATSGKADAEAALAKARRAGYADARVQHVK